jgi:hypothetical protein
VQRCLTGVAASHPWSRALTLATAGAATGIVRAAGALMVNWVHCLSDELGCAMPKHGDKVKSSMALLLPVMSA